MLREDKLNALNIELIQEIEIARLNSEKSVRGIILTGNRTKRSSFDGRFFCLLFEQRGILV